MVALRGTGGLISVNPRRTVESAMANSLLNRAFWTAAAIAAVVEGTLLYQQWPPPPVKICASTELGELLAAAAKTNRELHEARAQLLSAPNEATPKLVMNAEAAAAAAANAVTEYKQREIERQKAGGGAARNAACS
jgi:hypothetical protein